MSPKIYTTLEAAEIIGVSRQTLYTWIAQRKIDAPESVKIGNGSMRFWAKAQVDAAKKFKGTQKPGRVPKKK